MCVKKNLNYVIQDLYKEGWLTFKNKNDLTALLKNERKVEITKDLVLLLLILIFAVF